MQTPCVTAVCATVLLNEVCNFIHFPPYETLFNISLMSQTTILSPLLRDLVLREEEEEEDSGMAAPSP